ncbi:hypothetical protein [Mesorhizobium sp. B3-1-9]|uniref:hypothetical protein n=1 Tax=Mesorhizobium sp. B3-1-9 TaxID=2589892 RepID=UPI0015E403F1|nr:hypothetical protein [Mesorhizobium sp. B3-1-9]
MTEKTDETKDQKASAKSETSKKTTVKAAGKQKFTQEELKQRGLDPACYGYVK